MSEHLVEYIFESQQICERFEIDRRDMQLVKQLISGRPSVGGCGLPSFPMYLFDIVNNRANGIDVDKLDYLQRDTLYTNVRVAAPYGRLLTFAMVWLLLLQSLVLHSLLTAARWRWDLLSPERERQSEKGL